MRDSHADFVSSGRELEDAFFLNQDKKLKQQLAVIKKMKETKETLKKVSGIENDTILQKLVDLKIPPQIVASMSIIPLVEVAWADGTVGQKEQEVVMKAAHLKEEIDKDLLKIWLTHKPEQHLMDAWTHYIAGLCETLNETERKLLKQTLLEHAYDVAKAEGGFLGIGPKISKEEKSVLDKLEKAFC